VIDYDAFSDGTEMLIGADFFLSHHIYVSGSQHRLDFTYNGGPVFDLSHAKADTSATPLADPNELAPGKDKTPADAAAYARRGTASMQRRDYAHALEDLDRACEMDPTQSDYFYERALAHSYNGQILPAASDFDTALKLKPDNLDALMGRSSLRFRGGDRAGALADLDAADKLATHDSDVRRKIALGYETLDRLPDAVAQFDAWISTHPVDGGRSVALNGRCWARALLGTELDKALADCDAAVKLQPTNAGYLDSRGLVRLRRGEFAKAIADYDTALAANPKLPWSLFGRGIARIRLGQSTEGQADIAAAAAIDSRVAGDAKKHGIEP
jgi:tetratricopeptide (TPR) repeat protein